MDVFTLIPWILFLVTVLFTIFFVVWAWLTTRKARSANGMVEAMRSQLQQLEVRAITAETQVNAAVERATLAEQRIAHAEDRMTKARDVAKTAETKAEDAERRLREAVQRADSADSAYQSRRNEAEERERQARQRGQALLSWAQQQWETRREADRQSAQAEHGSFQAQLERYLALRAVPVSFRVTNDMDRMAAPSIASYVTNQVVKVEGDLVTVAFPVDAAAGFRA